MKNNKSKEELVRLLEEPDATACYVWVIMHGRSLLGYINELETAMNDFEAKARKVKNKLEKKGLYVEAQSAMDTFLFKKENLK